MPSSYDWVEHTTSEAAGQGVANAWVTRTGFVAMGLAVLVLTGAATARRPAERWLHAVFGSCMLAVAACSSRPWTDVAFDALEDVLHSVAATAMGFAFAGAVAVSMFPRDLLHPHVRLLDAAALAASVLVPLAMVSVPGSAGLLQRVMFAVALTWYASAACGGPASRGDGQAG